jgi:hypothetical protein
VKNDLLDFNDEFRLNITDVTVCIILDLRNKILTVKLNKRNEDKILTCMSQKEFESESTESCLKEYSQWLVEWS